MVMPGISSHNSQRRFTENRNIVTGLYHHVCDFLTRNNKTRNKKNKTRQGVERHVKKKYTPITKNKVPGHENIRRYI